MRYLRIFLFIIVIAGGLSGCEKKRISEKYRAEAEQDIFQLQSQYSQAINTKDLNKLTFLYADNGALYDEHNPIIRGKNAVREAWKIDFARPGLTLETFPGGVEIEDGGNLAWGHGTFRMTTDSRAKYWADRWRYALVYTRQPDGKWKIMADSAHSGLRNRLLQTPPKGKSPNASIAPLIGLSLFFSSLWFVLGMPILMIIFGCIAFRKRRITTGLIVSASMFFGFVLTAGILWLTLSGQYWNLPLQNAFAAAADTERYGNPVEDTAESVLISLLALSALAGFTAGIISRTAVWLKLRWNVER